MAPETAPLEALAVSDAPLLNMRFRVEIDGLKAGSVFEVTFPQVRLLAGGRTGRRVEYGPLILKRGIPRASEWYPWWDEARRSRKPPARDVTVTLLDNSGADAQRWLFNHATPVAYTLSSLNAMGNEPLMETLELAVSGFEASAQTQKGTRGRRTRAG